MQRPTSLAGSYNKRLGCNADATKISDWLVWVASVSKKAEETSGKVKQKSSQAKVLVGQKFIRDKNIENSILGIVDDQNIASAQLLVGGAQ
ncbi:hypothetical protein WN51_07587 [Melipona quadrifasciata]|uniref:Uncharacterized protein n=1 Tax=Melipona quadrifasciata TaxID=166423 RepID=A0A0M8ZRA0_9HYME|nr:hypothetical protein WN51_07587 [Melipona quadrifasciata]